MKVLIVNNSSSALGGAHDVFNFESMLLDNNGIQIKKFSPDNIENINKNPFKRLKDYIYSKDICTAIRNEIDVFKPDLIHMHLFIGGLTSSVVDEAYKKNIPIIHTVHDYRLICAANNMIDSNDKVCTACINSRLSAVIKKCSHNNLIYSSATTIESYFRYFQNINKKISRYIFVSEFAKNIHSKFDSVFHERGCVLQNCNQMLTPLKNKDISEREGFLYFGRLSREKGLKTLLKVFEKLPFKISIAGDGPLKELVQNSSDHNENINYMGRLNKARLHEQINNAKFTICPSEWFENNPISIIESQAFGTPVVASDIGGIPEMVENENTGYLFKSGSEAELSALVKKLDTIQPNEWCKLSQKCIEKSRERDQETHFFNLKAIYQDVISKK